MFSVIIPLYNKEKYVSKAINSVIEQTFQNFELIIVNDGSTDNSLLVIKQFLDKRIIIINQPNSGVSVARSIGVKSAKYHYIAFLDADDWWESTYLQEMARLILSFPNAGIYSCQYYWEKKYNRKISVNHKAADFEGYLDYFEAYTFAWWMPVTSITAVIPSGVFNEFGGSNPKLKFGEDFDLWVKIMLKYKLAYINRPLAFYNQDIAEENRALGPKLWNKEEHYIFNLSFLDEEERRNPRLKKLLDGLRVRALIRYHLSEKYEDEVAREIAKVDFTKQSGYFKFIYKYPRIMVKLFFFLKKQGSLVKQFLKRRKRE